MELQLGWSCILFQSNFFVDLVYSAQDDFHRELSPADLLVYQHLDEFRKVSLMKLRRYLHKGLLDQVLVLKEVALYVDELSIVGVLLSGQGVPR